MNKEREREFVDKTARLVLARLVGQSGKKELVGEYALFAWQAAETLLEERKKRESAKYMDVLQNYQGTEALRRVLELGGNTGRCLDYMVERYAGKPDPLRAFAEEDIGYRTAGQEAVRRYLEKRDAE